MQFPTITLTFALIILSTISNVLTSKHPQPQPKQKIQCGPSLQDPYKIGQLYAGQGYYGGEDFKLGYKYVKSSDGKEDKAVVVNKIKNDSNFRLLNNVYKIQCNLSYMNAFSHPGQFNFDTPVKLIGDINKDGNPLCVGLNEINTNDTFITLVPCSEIDDESQTNQFWMEEFKFFNLYPISGKSDSADDRLNYFKLYAPEKDANPPVYTTQPHCDIDKYCQEYSFVVSS